MRFSIRRLMISIALLAIGVSLLVSLSRGQIDRYYSQASLALAFASLVQGPCLLVATKPLEFFVPALIGALLGLLMIPAT